MKARTTSAIRIGNLAATAAMLALVVFFMSPKLAKAQNNVGINTLSPNITSILDLTSTNTGLLVPRMTTTNRLLIGAGTPATGLLVYDTTLQEFYYYNGTMWLPFLSSAAAATGWLHTGNAGTTPSSNFLGTTDANDMVFKTNSVEGMRLTTGSDLAIGATTATQKLEVAGNARLDPVAGTASQFQFMNPAGTYGTTFAAGAQAATVNYTLPTAQGALNTMLTNNGAGALSWAAYSNTTGWLLTGNSGTTAGTNFIGTTDANDFVVKTNASEGFRLTSAGLVGFGTSTPSQQLDVAGNIKIDSVGGAASQVIFSNPAGTFTTNIQAGAQAATINYTLPLSQGAANTVLTDNGSGTLSWLAPGSLNWSLVGNAGTVAGTNYEGTQDAVDMVWKTNNVEGMRLSSTQNLGIGTNAPTSKLHTVASGAKTTDYTGNLLTNIATSSTAAITKYGADLESTGTWNGAGAVNAALHVNVSGGTTNYSGIFQGGNVGINTTTPATYADINGDLATRYTSFTAANGNNNNIAIGAYSFVRFTGPTAAYTITGVAGGVDGKVLVLYNSTTQSFTISNEDANSTAANRIWTLNSNGNLIIAGRAAVKMMYSAPDSRWIVIGSSLTTTSSSDGEEFAKKPVDQSITSSTTLTNDNDLYLPIAANDSMIIEGSFWYNGSTGDIQLTFTVPSGAAMDFCIFSETTSHPESHVLTTSGTSTGRMNMISGDVPIDVQGVVITNGTAGNIQLKWAQGVSSATASTLKVKSHMHGTLIR